VLYRLWTGQLPFQGETPFAIAHRQLNEAPPPLKDVAPDLPSWCDLVLSRAIAKNPSERYQTALEFKNALATAATFMSLDDVATVTLRTPRAVMLPMLTPSKPVSAGSSRAAPIPTPSSQPSRAHEVISTLRSTSAAQPAAGPPMMTAPSATVPNGTPAAGAAQTPVAQPATGPVTATPPTTGRTVVISPRHVFAGVTSLMIVLVVLAIGTVLAVKRIQQQKLVADQAPATSTTTVAPPSALPAPTAPVPPQADASTPSSASPVAATADVPARAAVPPVASPAPVSGPPKSAGATVGNPAAGGPAGVQANGKSPAASTTPLPAKPLPSPAWPVDNRPPAADTLPPVSFDKVKLLVVEGDKAREDDAELRFANGTVQILGASDRVIGSIPYQSVHTVTATRSKQPRWRGPDGAVVDAKMSSGAFGFLKSDRNWVGLVTPSAAYVFRVDDGDLQKLTETATKRTGATLVRIAGK